MHAAFLIVTVLLLVCVYGALVTNGRKRKVCFGILMSVLSVISLPLFLCLQNASGGVDHGELFGQRILPVGGYVLALLLGVFICIHNRRKLQ